MKNSVHLIYPLACLTLLSLHAASAGTLTVTNTNDAGPGSLRAAIAAASSGDTIAFDLAYPAVISLGSTLLVNTDLTISGPGASNLSITGNNAVKVIQVAYNPALILAISGLTIRDGFTDGGGGGIGSAGILTVSDTTFSGNSANYGGAIASSGSLTVTNSRFLGNTAYFNGSGGGGGGAINIGNGSLIMTGCSVSGNSAYDGGGIFDIFSASTITDSTISGNSATSSSGGGGGIFHYNNSLKVVNSTVAGNSAPNGGGGGIQNIGDGSGTLTVINSTLSGNSALFGGGISGGSATALKNTILANSQGGNCLLPSGVSLGHNLSDDSTCSFLSVLGDLNGATSGLDPVGLQNNGGLTQTIRLLSTSAAVDAIPVSPINYCTALDGVTSIATDQRGMSRPMGAACDIGAFEFVPPLDTIGPVTSNVSVTPNPLAVNRGSSLLANVSDGTTGGSNIASAYYNINGGVPVQMSLNPSPAVTTQASAVLGPLAGVDVYNVCVRGTDSAGNTGASACVLLPVYDPSAGFVTGGGQVASPAGADLLNTASAGQATFGFVSNYLPGRNTPSGNLEFQFKEGSLNFKSTSMDWLVVTGQPLARFHGIGTVNGANVCNFEVDAWAGSAQPGNVDAFGLKITGCASGGDRYILPATPLTKGSIIIHK